MRSEKMNQNNKEGCAHPKSKPYNVYSGYFPSKHNRLCSPRDFNDRWVAEQLSAERNRERTELIFSHAVCVLLGAMVVLAVLT
jgi:predicted nucleic acid-binding Zn ribbon protein